MKTSAETAESIKATCATEMANHALKDEGGSEIVHSWRCATPGTGTWAFRVIIASGTIIVTGDIGELILVPHGPGGLPWLRGAIRDRGYLLSKAAAWGEPIKEFKPDIALKCVDEWRGDPDEDCRISASVAVGLQVAICDDEQRPIDAWMRACMDAQIDDPPTCEDWSDRTLVLCEALEWFVKAEGRS